MKKISVFGVVAILFLSLVTVAFADAGDIDVTLMSQSPDPVEPGQIVTVKFKVENAGAETTKDTIVHLRPSFPFSLYGDVVDKNIGKLRAGSTGANAIIVEYKLKVDEEAVEGYTELELEVGVNQAGVAFVNDEFLINIETHDAVLEITKISMEPERIAPGGTATLTIFTKNLADSLLKDIKFTFDFESSDLPLAPYQTSSQKRIAQLNSNNQLPLTLPIIADPEAKPGLYKVPVNITYNDEKGNRLTIEDVVAVQIGSAPDLKTYIKRSTVLRKGETGSITIELANTGTDDIKFLELEILPTKDFEVLSTSPYAYIGDVDSDDTESEEFQIFVKRSVKTLMVPVMLRYTDANNNPIEEKTDLELRIYSGFQLREFGLVASSSSGVYILLILLGVGGYFFYTKRYKKKKRSQEE
ncbi:MAG: COG1361 S-layer family protein [archaeon]|nr:COG1361 S-layer family protein [archaeon]